MKNTILSSLNKKQLFIITFPIVCFISSFFIINLLATFLPEPTYIFYMSRIILIALTLLTILISVGASRSLVQIGRHYAWGVLLGILFAYYLSTFLHAYNPSVFLIDLFIPSLLINLILSLCLSLLISRKKAIEVNS